MLFATTCCVYKSTSYIYFFNNCKEKMHIFHMTLGYKRSNISRNTCWNCNFSLPFKNLPLKLQVIQILLQKLGRNSLCLVLNISYFSHFTSNISGQQFMGLEAALTWKTFTFGLTKKLPCLDSSFTKKTTLNYTVIFGSFSIPNGQR